MLGELGLRAISTRQQQGTAVTVNFVQWYLARETSIKYLDVCDPICHVFDLMVIGLKKSIDERDQLPTDPETCQLVWASDLTSFSPLTDPCPEHDALSPACLCVCVASSQESRWPFQTLGRHLVVTTEKVSRG